MLYVISHLQSIPNSNRWQSIPSNLPHLQGIIKLFASPKKQRATRPLTKTYPCVRVRNYLD